ncbi:MAG: hypothetical protein HUK26_09755 [Duodenibacillus sp.]|nr:hypothetical protein [Duodenibacillus sp.]
MQACRELDYDAVFDALNDGADPDAIDEDGLTPLVHVIWSGYCGIGNYRERVRRQTPIVELLLSRGADPNLYGFSPCCPLSACAESAALELAELLLSEGADPNVNCDFREVVEFDPGWRPDNLERRSEALWMAVHGEEVHPGRKKSEKARLEKIAELLRDHGAVD